MTDRVRLRVLLSAMMFLQYAAWGAWTPVLGATLTNRLNASGVEVGSVYGVLWLACIITPFIGGQIVDRLLPGQIYLAISGAVCAISAWMMSTQPQFGGILLWMWIWSLAFAPTLGITNAIAFHHLSKEGKPEVEQERDFAVIRTAGTIGWIVAAFILTYYLTTRPDLPKGQWAPFEEMQVSAAFAAILAVVSFFLPHTPPSKEKTDPWAFTKAFALFKTVPGFAVFMLISFVVSTEFQFFYVLSAPFLQDIGVPTDWLSSTKSISQVAEIVSMAVLLPLSLKYLGMRWTLVLGTLAWPLRYVIFAIGQPLWLVVLSLMFHGIGFAFVFVTSYLYVDRVAPKDIRGSAQNLLTLVTLGLGNWLGTIFCGWLKDHYTKFVPDPANPGKLIPAAENAVAWSSVFMVPAVMTIICAVAFYFTFREPKIAQAEPEEVPQARLQEAQ
ncbi:MAG TPA: MFS transporter [Armatimonadaceae bacterium]|jgi:nucleoside transporter|nr:MFS transporter [Armatimonadaceae bacterium]